MKTQIKTAPTVEPLTLSEVKTHLRVDADITAEDTLLTSLIVAAREYVEQYTGRVLITQTWYAYLDQFPSEDRFCLPFGNLSSVTSVKYKNSSGDETTMTATTQYLVDADTEPGRIVLPYSVSWPSFTAYPVNPIVVEFVCGYGLAASVPDALKSVMKLFIGDLYENRESQTIANTVQSFAINETANNLMHQYRLWGVY